MGERDRFVKNVFMERLWYFLTCEANRLDGLAGGFNAHNAIQYRMTFYNAERLRSALERGMALKTCWLGGGEKLAA